jgi:hypothetical protein
MGWITGVRMPARAKIFLCSTASRTGSGAYPTFCPMGTGGFFPGEIQPGHESDHSPPSCTEIRGLIFPFPHRPLSSWYNSYNEHRDHFQLYISCWHRWYLARGNRVGSGTIIQAGRSRVWILMRSWNFFSLLNPSSRTMVLGSTQPLTEMSTRNLPGGPG